MICIGILAALLVNVALSAAQWRTMFAMSAAPAALLALGERCGRQQGRRLSCCRGAAVAARRGCSPRATHLPPRKPPLQPLFPTVML